MLETVDFSQAHLAKEEYKAQHDALVKELIMLQQEAVRRGVGLVVLFEGWNGAGKGSRISDLLYSLDARSTSVYVTPDLDAQELINFPGHIHGVENFFPSKQEFWEALGPRGAITFYDRGWYAKAAQELLAQEAMELFPDRSAEEIVEMLLKTNRKTRRLLGESQFETLLSASKRTREIAQAKQELARARAALTTMVSELQASEERAENALDRQITSAADFERQLVDDGYLVVKFFVHVTARSQKKRLKKLHRNPSTRWRVSKQKLASADDYDSAYLFYDNLLEGTNFDYAPWVMVNGEDKRGANLTIAQTLVDALRGRLSQEEDPAAKAAAAKAQANSAGKLGNQSAEMTPEEKQAAAQAAADEASKLAPKESRYQLLPECPHVDDVDHTLALTRESYKRELKVQQKRLNKLEMQMYQKRIPMIIMYEGWDAAGKGGSIKRVAQALDARAYTIFTSPAPTKPELMHPFLWRYWTRLPKAGHVGIYDRSWYGRVLVERVEGFASPEQWSRAYDEINEFERELVRWGAVVVKFWVDISPDEQLNRFHARQADPSKQWKITDEDWRNREKYPQYKAAVEDMFRLTNTTYAPWHILESDDKLYARVKALKVINDTLEARLNQS